MKPGSSLSFESHWIPRLAASAALVAACAITGCASAPPPPPPAPPKPCPPPEVSLSLVASAKVNPATDGQGRPVQVRAYQLVSDARLRNAPFEDIWQKDKEALQTDLLSVEQYALFPGETKEVALKPNPQAHYLALVALFREPQGKDWYMSVELPEAAASASCGAAKTTISAWLDRMQIQDGQGRSEDSAAQPTQSGGH